MLSRQELKERLEPLIETAGTEPSIFADLAIPIMQEHMRGVQGATSVEAAFDVWNSVIQELLTQFYRAGFFAKH